MNMSDDGSARPTSQTRTNASLLGEVAWLMLCAAERRAWHVRQFTRLVMPPLAHRQYRLYYDGDAPIAFVSWALLSPEAEMRFLTNPLALEPQDWISGNILHIVDFLAPAGAMAKIAPLLRRDPLLRERPIRATKQRNGERKLIEISANVLGGLAITVRPLVPSGSATATSD